MSVSPLARLVLSCLFFWFASGVAFAQNNGLPRPMMGKEFLQRLLHPESRSDAFYELVLRLDENKKEPRWKNLPRNVFDDAMQDVRLTECPGREGDTPLYLVTHREDFDKWYAATNPLETALVSGYREGDIYPPTAEEQRLQERWKSNAGPHHLNLLPTTEPLLAPALKDKVLIFLDANGQVQWPHGGDNMGAESSSIFDLNGDGIFDRIDHTNYGISEKIPTRTTLQVLKIRSVEKNPRLLLAVIFNWHPDKADAANRWWYEIKHIPGDDLPVIALGPQPGQQEGTGITTSSIEYHWDKIKNCYVGPNGEKGNHFLRLDVTQDQEIWTKIKQIAEEGGLGYPLLGDLPPNANPTFQKDDPIHSGNWKDWPKYQHHKLAAMSNDELFHWQYGGEPEKGKSPDSWVDVVVPPWLRKLPPREAALALAEANRTKAHRSRYDLVILDLPKPLPKDGVLVMDVHPGMSFSYEESIRLNETDTEWWTTQGLAQAQPAYRRDTSGILPWLAEVIAWLDQVRTVPRALPQPETESPGLWSDTTTVGILWQRREDETPIVQYRFSEPQFAGRQWKGPYTRLVAQTLAVNLWIHFTSIWTEDKLARLSNPTPPEAKPVATWEELSQKYRRALAAGSEREYLRQLLLISDNHQKLWDLRKLKFDGAYGGFNDELIRAI